MYKRDLITAKIQKLAQILAKVMSLKLEENFGDAQDLFDETMANSFELSKEILEDSELSNFENWLINSDFSAEKLDSLSEFLYYDLGVSPERNKLIAPKLNLIYQLLFDRYKIVHLVSFHRQNIIQQYLS